jgi:hypothetical protein
MPDERRLISLLHSSDKITRFEYRDWKVLHIIHDEPDELMDEWRGSFGDCTIRAHTSDELTTAIDKHIRGA